MTRATSPWHSAHLPTRSKSPPLIVPLKLVIVDSCRHWPHQTLDSRRLRRSAGMDSQRSRAGSLKVGEDSMDMAHRTQWRACFPSGLTSIVSPMTPRFGSGGLAQSACALQGHAGHSGRGFGGGVGKPADRQGTALFNEGVDLLNYRMASKRVFGVRLELARRRWQ